MPRRSSNRSESSKSSNEEQEEEEFSEEFSDDSVRRIFMAKIYSILFVEALLIYGIHFVFKHFLNMIKNDEKLSKPDKSLTSLIISSCVAILMITISLMLCCCSNLRRKMPMNAIFLFIITTFSAYSLERFTNIAKSNIFQIMLGIIAINCLIFTIYFFLFEFDLNGKKQF
jgi:FtsH-binding integral membrane protein